MRFRDSLAVNVSPILLRLVLGVTFLWAGYGKVFTTATFSPEQIAILDAMDSSDAGEPSPDAELEVIVPADADPDAEPMAPEAPLPEPDETDGGPNAMAPAGFVVITVQDGVVEDEIDTEGPDVNERRKVNYLAMMIKNAATPDEQGASLLPSYFGQGEWPVRLAWIAALTELLGGVFVLLGFLIRLSALGLAFTMLTALWMTAIGPVILFDAPSSFGFLPALDDFAISAWQGWLWQFALLGAALSLALSGPGALSADRMLLGRRASKKAKPGSKPKPKPEIDADDD